MGKNNNEIIHKCPNCGSNLDINFTGICSYCNQSVNLEDDYILINLI